MRPVFDVCIYFCGVVKKNGGEKKREGKTNTTYEGSGVVYDADIDVVTLGRSPPCKAWEGEGGKVPTGRCLSIELFDLSWP